MLLRDQKMIQRAEIAMNMARKEYYPDYTVSFGYFNQGSMPAMYQARVDFKLPAYFWRKQRRPSLSRRRRQSALRSDKPVAELSHQGRL
jgi:hypothetical protein